MTTASGPESPEPKTSGAKTPGEKPARGSKMSGEKPTRGSKTPGHSKTPGDSQTPGDTSTPGGPEAPTEPRASSGPGAPTAPRNAIVFDDPLSQRSSDDSDEGWGERPSGGGSGARDLAWFLDEKPPHHL